MKKTLSDLLMASLSLAAGTVSKAAGGVAERLFKSPAKGGLELTSVGRIGFGPEGLLLVSSPRDASVLAIDTGDAGPVEKLAKKIEVVDALFGAVLVSQLANDEVVVLRETATANRHDLEIAKMP